MLPVSEIIKWKGGDSDELYHCKGKLGMHFYDKEGLFF
jgi:hypothetical protein